MKSLRFVLMFTVCLTASAAAMKAETLQGTVAAVNPSEKDAVILLQEKGGREIQILVSERARLLGPSSLSDLNAGDEVLVQGDAGKDGGLWKAEFLELRRRAE